MLCFALYEIVAFFFSIFDYLIILFSFFARRFTGIEFAVVHAQPQPPTFFIIQKRERLSPDEGTSCLPCCCFVVISVVFSKTFGSLFHYEQPHISIARSVYYSIQSSCKILSHPGGPVSKHFQSCFFSSLPSRLSKLLWISCGNIDQIIRQEQDLPGLFPTRRL